MSIINRMQDVSGIELLPPQEYECSFEVSFESHSNFWEACSAIITESGVDPDLVLGACKQPFSASNGNPIVGITVLGEATARKLVCHHCGLDEDDEDVSRYYN